MQLGTISTNDNPQPRLALRVGKDQVLDVQAALEIAGLGTPMSSSLRWHIENQDVEREALERLATWAQGLTGEDARKLLLSETDIRFHPPVPDPVKFLCVGKNYAAHLDELARTELINELPDEPTGFVKLNEVLCGHGSSVARPNGIVKFDYEPEVVFVIGKPAYRVSRENALDYVFGMTLFNDLTAREIQKREVRSGTRFWTAKNMPGFGPLGPWVMTLDEIADVNDLKIECHVNGERRMGYNTRDQIHKLADIIAHFSKYMPLHPGDLFAMGSAAGVAVGQPNADKLFLRPGDRVDVTLQGVMTLSTEIT
uniref:fumarylacetoacetate hydrolase family protein n=1 Tax=Pararhizobium sp. IMCC3301 TaxID=3067904 RepID=UPI002741B23D|nr:fumarylacetoacetate hydrolase family protein [Pararhizobium sp. IMCC3301]